jgi:hypothetical protein
MFRLRAILVGHSTPPDLDRASHGVHYFEGKNPAMRRPNRHKFGKAAQPHMELVKTLEGDRAGAILLWSDRTSVKIRALHCRFDNPTTAVQENGTYGGQGKAVGFPRLTALLCLGGSNLTHTQQALQILNCLDGRPFFLRRLPAVGFPGRAGSWDRFDNPSRRVGDPRHCMGTKAKPLAHAMPLAALLSLSRVQPPRGRIAYPFPAEDEHE